MKAIIPLWFFLLAAFLQVNGQIAVKFVRPSNTLGASEKIQITILGNDYLIKDSSSISLNLNPDYQKSTEIICSLPSGLSTNYYLDAKPKQTYVFEVGLRVNGIYISLVKGEEDIIVSKADNQLKLDQSTKKTKRSDELLTPEERWQKRNGKNGYFSLMAAVIISRTEVGSFGWMNGGGGGYSFGYNSLKVKMPELNKGSSKWNSFNWGLGCDFNLNGFEFNTILRSGGQSITTNYSYLILNLQPFANVGWTWGFGKYTDDNTWKGIALTLKYRPTFTRSLTTCYITKSSSDPLIDPKETSSDFTDSKFNYAGVGLDVDFIRYSNMGRKICSRPRVKFSLVLLPPVGDNPMFLSFNLGLTIYKRKR